MPTARLPAAALVCALAGCATGGAPSEFRWTPEVQPGTYFPLAQGTAWSYDVADAQSGERMLMVNRVLRREGPRAIFFEEPDPLAYEDRGGEILRLPSGTAVLRAPIARGASWAIPGGTARVLSVDGEVTTPGGRYPGCVVVEEATGERRVVTSYAPAVGPVRVEIYARGPGAESLAHRALLRSYHAGGTPIGGP
jgi:hypothetical protein